MLKRFFIVCMLAFVAVTSAIAASVRPLALGELIDTAAVAFEGTCIGNRTEREAATNLVVTYTTFAVKDVLKGDVGETYVIKQLGGEIADGQPSIRVQGIPKFALGASYVVFLASVSSAGFSSPIGLEQGNFKVLPDAAGAKVANGRDFREMTAGMPPSAMPPATARALSVARAPVHQLGLDEFKQLVRTRTGRTQ